MPKGRRLYSQANTNDLDVYGRCVPDQANAILRFVFRDSERNDDDNEDRLIRESGHNGAELEEISRVINKLFGAVLSETHWRLALTENDSIIAAYYNKEEIYLVSEGNTSRLEKADLEEIKERIDYLLRFVDDV